MAQLLELADPHRAARPKPRSSMDVPPHRRRRSEPPAEPRQDAVIAAASFRPNHRDGEEPSKRPRSTGPPAGPRATSIGDPATVRRATHRAPGAIRHALLTARRHRHREHEEHHRRTPVHSQHQLDGGVDQGGKRCPHRRHSVRATRGRGTPQDRHDAGSRRRHERQGRTQGAKRFPGKCFACSRPGHRVSECHDKTALAQYNRHKAAAITPTTTATAGQGATTSSSSSSSGTSS